MACPRWSERFVGVCCSDAGDVLQSPPSKKLSKDDPPYAIKTLQKELVGALGPRLEKCPGICDLGPDACASFGGRHRAQSCLACS